MSEVVRLKTSYTDPVKRACATCKHLRKHDSCGATGRLIVNERHFAGAACKEEGHLWEKKEPWPGLLPMVVRFMFGGK